MPPSTGQGPRSGGRDGRGHHPHPLPSHPTDERDAGVLYARAKYALSKYTTEQHVQSLRLLAGGTEPAPRRRASFGGPQLGCTRRSKKRGGACDVGGDSDGDGDGRKGPRRSGREKKRVRYVEADFEEEFATEGDSEEEASVKGDSEEEYATEGDSEEESAAGEDSETSDMEDAAAAALAGVAASAAAAAAAGMGAVTETVPAPRPPPLVHRLLGHHDQGGSSQSPSSSHANQQHKRQAADAIPGGRMTGVALVRI